MQHTCLWLFIHPCMLCSLCSRTMIQEAFFVPCCPLAPSMGGPCCRSSAVVFVQFRGLCFSGMSLHANQSRRPAACFLSHSYTSAGFRGETGQNAEKHKMGGEAGSQRNSNALPSNLSCHFLTCVWEVRCSEIKGLAHMLTASLFTLHFDSLFCVIYTHIFPSSFTLSSQSHRNTNWMYFVWKSSVSPKGVCYGSNSHSVTRANSLHSGQGHIVPYLWSKVKYDPFRQLIFLRAFKLFS